MKIRQKLIELIDVSEGQFTDDIRMDDHASLFEKSAEPRILLVKMVDPNRGVGEDDHPSFSMADDGGAVPSHRVRCRPISQGADRLQSERKLAAPPGWRRILHACP